MWVCAVASVQSDEDPWRLVRRQQLWGSGYASDFSVRSCRVAHSPCTCWIVIAMNGDTVSTSGKNTTHTYTSMNFLKFMLFIWTLELQIHFSEEKRPLVLCFLLYHIFYKLILEIIIISFHSRWFKKWSKLSLRPKLLFFACFKYILIKLFAPCVVFQTFCERRGGEFRSGGEDLGMPGYLEFVRIFLTKLSPAFCQT